MRTFRRLFWIPAVAGMTIAPALAQHHTEWRAAYLDCGKTHVRALAECYETTDFCISESLTFVRPGRRAVVGMHQHYETFDLKALKVQALDYHAAAWACVPGRRGGHYLSVVMEHAGTCHQCSYIQLFDHNGHLVAASIRFDSRGRPRENVQGAALIQRLTGRLAPQAFASIYKKP